MRACQYQDVPGRRGLCLRTFTWDEWPHAVRTRWAMCDEERSDRCPQRYWDADQRERLRVTRNAFLGRCDCGRPHDSVLELLTCMMERQVRSAIDPCPSPGRDGSKEPLLHGDFPSSVRQMAWRRVRRAVVDRDGHRCQECGRDLRPLPSWYTEVHHIVPRIDSGGDRPENLITLCVECHGRHTDDLCSVRLRDQ